ncbi:MAG: hypothetical protein OEZ34_15050, partial [Spirochaetia bacterium]|nr:hypothetical protein [Spirochaetia bacterium]
MILHKMKDQKISNKMIFGLTGIVFLSMAFLTNCNYDGNKSGIHWFLDMHDSLALEPQEEDITTMNQKKPDSWFQGSGKTIGYNGPGSAMRVPPEGTVPRNYIPYPFEAGEFDRAGKELSNPLQQTKSILARGKKQYDIYCAICHGKSGKGDGNVSPMFGDVPPLLTGPAA